MRVLILGGTLFIGRRIALGLLARGDEVMVVHRGQTEPAELSGCAHVHAARDALAGVADQLRAFRPDAVIDTRAMTRAHADAVLPHLPDAHLVLLSSIDVYRAYELLLAGQGGEPVPLTETSPVRSARYPLRGLVPGLGEHYDKLDVEPLYLARGGCVLRLSTRKCWAMLLVSSRSGGTRSSGTVTSDASEPAAARMASAQSRTVPVVRSPTLNTWPAAAEG